MNLPTPQELKKKRIELGLTQSELAKAAEISQGLVARIESGKVDPRLSTLSRIVNVLETADKSIKRARDIMTKSVLTIKPNETINRAIKLMHDNGISQLPVVDNGTPVGLVTETSLLLEIEKSKDPHSLRNRQVSQVMDDLPPILSPATDLRTILPILELNPVVLVSEKGKLVGIITTSNILDSI